MNLVTRSTIALLLSILTLVCTGCNAGPPLPDMSVEPFPVGTYTQLEYGWLIEADGTYTFYALNDPETNWPGSYTIVGDQITIKDSMCPDGKEGLYQWTFDGDVLRFKTLRENCGGRSQYMVRLPWSLVE